MDPKKIKILAVDDEPSLLKSVKSILLSDGYNVVTAKNGKEAVEVFKKESPDLVIESIEGGKGVTVVVANNGNGNASALDVTITVEGGLLILVGEYDYPETLAAGESAEISLSVIGIGLGIFTPMPEITVTAECAEGSTAEETAEATVLFFTVTLQE